MVVLETEALSKRYPGGGGCFDVSLRLEAGDTLGLLGPNGAGKSTFIKMLVGLVPPTSGKARILGLPHDSPEARRSIGFLPENFRYHDWMTASELLLFHGELHGLSRAETRRRIGEVLELVGLAGLERRLVRTFSKGMQQRLGLAVALLPQPKLLFLDEPTSALDPLGRREMRDIMQRLHSQGMTIFLNSHLLSEVEKVCRKVAVIRKGHIVATGELDQLLGAGQAREVQLEVSGLSPALLQAIESVAAVLQRGDDAATGITKLSLRVDGKDRLPALAEIVVRGGGRLHSMATAQNSLEDLFVGLMAGDHASA
ncbi:MAG: ABC transporter ATP-binding protein [Chloroflexota bacterium]